MNSLLRPSMLSSGNKQTAGRQLPCGACPASSSPPPSCGRSVYFGEATSSVLSVCDSGQLSPPWVGCGRVTGLPAAKRVVGAGLSTGPASAHSAVAWSLWGIAGGPHREPGGWDPSPGLLAATLRHEEGGRQPSPPGTPPPSFPPGAAEPLCRESVCGPSPQLTQLTQRERGDFFTFILFLQNQYIIGNTSHTGRESQPGESAPHAVRHADPRPRGRGGRWGLRFGGHRAAVQASLPSPTRPPPAPLCHVRPPGSLPSLPPQAAAVRW